MRREMKLLEVFLVLVVIASSTACRHKPAYSEIDANKASSSQNRNSDVQGGTATPGAEQSPTVGQPSPPAQNFKTPRFMDPVTGNIRDLPSHPRTRRLNVQVGPNQGVNVMTLVLQTDLSMDEIAAYYQQVIKDNKWTVTDKTLDYEMSEWTLTKGEDDSAKIQVKKDPKTHGITIFIVRGEKLEETKK